MGGCSVGLHYCSRGGKPRGHVFDTVCAHATAMQEQDDEDEEDEADDEDDEYDLDDEFDDEYGYGYDEFDEGFDEDDYYW